MIAHIVLNVSNFERSEAFYDRLLFALGFSVAHKEETADYSIKSYEEGSNALWIKREHKSSRQPFVRDVGLDHLALAAPSKSDVDSIFEELRLAGVTITRAPAYYPEYSSEYYAFYFRDPDGIPLEVVYY